MGALHTASSQILNSYDDDDCPMYIVCVCVCVMYTQAAALKFIFTRVKYLLYDLVLCIYIYARCV